MRSCAVSSCTWADRKFENSKVSFFRFPERKDLRDEWMVRCGLTPVVDPDSLELRVCSRHFDENDFERDLRLELLGVPSRKRLKNDAVPHLCNVKIKEEPIDVEYCDNDFTPSFLAEQKNSSGQDLGSLKELDSSLQNAASQQGPSLQQQQLYQELQIENIGSVSSTVQILEHIPSSTVGYVPSSLPASQTWPGDYEFSVSFKTQEKNTKGVSWTYSKIKDKLYVGKDCPCPINFSANAFMPSDVSVRVMALYTAPEMVSDVVKRCVNHSMEEIKNGLMEAEHLIRCESSNAVYHEDPVTKRHSVLVPFENPPVGQQYSTYIYKFVCFGSCSGGPNRRPLMLIFTLERQGEVIGRRKLDVKICACPGRDRKSEETLVLEAENKNRSSQKRKEQPPLDLANLSETFSFTKSVLYPAAKKMKPSHSRDGAYLINVEDKDCFEFLVQMEQFYNICKLMKDLSPDISKALLYYQKNKSRNKKDDGKKSSLHS